MPAHAAFNHIAFRCRDLPAQEAFYIKHFGFKRSRTFSRGEAGEFIMLKLGGVRLELFPSDPTKELPADAKGGEQTIGFMHLAFDVPRLEPVIEGLRAAGIEPDPIIDVSHVMKGARIVFFRDPENNLIELMEGYYDEE